MHDFCGVVGVCWLSSEGVGVGSYVLDGLLELQHRGQASAGVTGYSSDRDDLLRTVKGRGRVRDVFDSVDECSVGIGHVRYATDGGESLLLAQPVERRHGRCEKWFSFAFNGHVSNTEEVFARLRADGYHFTRLNDAECLEHLICEGIGKEEKGAVSYRNVFGHLCRHIRGAYSMALVDGTGNLVIARDPRGVRPLVYGVRGDGLFMAASESCALVRAGIDEFFDVPAGCLLVVPHGAGTFRLERYADVVEELPCFFEWVYFSSVASRLSGLSVYEVRQRFGRVLAAEEENVVSGDEIVVPVPETADVTAEAFGREMGLSVERVLLRNRYSGRSFIEGDADGVLRGKFHLIGGRVAGKDVYLVDDSIVKGKTARRIVGMLRDAGARSVHMRLASPAVVKGCGLGVDMPEAGGGLFYDGVGDHAGRLGLDSLRHLSLAGLRGVLDLGDGVCMGCVGGRHAREEGW